MLCDLFQKIVDSNGTNEGDWKWESVRLAFKVGRNIWPYKTFDASGLSGLFEFMEHEATSLDHSELGRQPQSFSTTIIAISEAVDNAYNDSSHHRF